MAAGVAKGLYTGAAPRSVGTKNGTGSRSAYTAGAIARPDQPWRALCGHSKNFRALVRCRRRARSFAKSGHGCTLGGLQRQSTTSSNGTMVSILMDESRAQWGQVDDQSIELLVVLIASN
jgi:hypothetical protein